MTLLLILIRWFKRRGKRFGIKQIITWLNRMRRMIIMSIIRIISNKNIVNTYLAAMYLAALYQTLNHYNWWLGVFDYFIMLLLYLKRVRFKHKSIESVDAENYSIWTPRKQAPLENPDEIIARKQNKKLTKKHIWICLPGGMQDVDPAMSALYFLDTFNGSKICLFNNPGISTSMINKPLISPTEPKYVIEYIRYLQDIHNYEVSLIGFSIGSVQALRTLHTINNNPDIYSLVFL